MDSQDATGAVGARRYYGKYRGVVVENIDPLQIGRIVAQVPDVLGETPSSWAMPCVPAAGIQAGCFIVPPVCSHVWIEFEQGNPDYPIWTGGFWSVAAEVPVLVTAPPPIPPRQNIVLHQTRDHPTRCLSSFLSVCSNGRSVALRQISNLNDLAERGRYPAPPLVPTVSASFGISIVPEISNRISFATTCFLSKAQEKAAREAARF
jgi:hypothetical protein